MSYSSIDWSVTAFIVGTLCDWCRLRSFTHVYGVHRSGVPVAAMLSYRLEIPMIDYKLSEHLPEDRDARVRILVVDDFMKTGITLQPYKAYGFSTAVLFMIRGFDRCTTPDWHGLILEKDVCPRLPWREV